MHKRNAGFTLVELMVVAVIVAILAAVAIPLMTANKDRAMATEGQAGCGTVLTAMRMYFAEHGSYPGSALSGAALLAALPGIKTGDLDGVYFNDGSYAITDPSSGTYTITATGMAGGDAAGDTVILAVPAGTWTGTLMQ